MLVSSKLETIMFYVYFNMDLLKVIKLLFLCLVLQERAHLIDTVDNKDVKKIERELKWWREETRGAEGEIEFHDAQQQ